MEKEDTCLEGSVTSNTYIAVRTYDDRIVGIIDLRHHINHPILGLWGGHMGYIVRPSERRKVDYNSIINWQTFKTTYTLFVSVFYIGYKQFYITSFPMDCVHAVATGIFLWFLSEGMLEKLDRIKVKYGLVE